MPRPIAVGGGGGGWTGGWEGEAQEGAGKGGGVRVFHPLTSRLRLRSWSSSASAPPTLPHLPQERRVVVDGRVEGWEFGFIRAVCCSLFVRRPFRPGLAAGLVATHVSAVPCHFFLCAARVRACVVVLLLPVFVVPPRIHNVGMRARHASPLDAHPHLVWLALFAALPCVFHQVLPGPALPSLRARYRGAR